MKSSRSCSAADLRTISNKLKIQILELHIEKKIKFSKVRVCLLVWRKKEGKLFPQRYYLYILILK